MLENILPAEELHGLARRKRQPLVYKSVRHALVEEEQAEGWTVVKRNRSSTRLSRPKTHFALLEDRAWSLLYRLGFTNMSGEGGAKIVVTNANSFSARKLYEERGFLMKTVSRFSSISADPPSRQQFEELVILTSVKKE